MFYVKNKRMWKEKWAYLGEEWCDENEEDIINKKEAQQNNTDLQKAIIRPLLIIRCQHLPSIGKNTYHTLNVFF